MVQREIIKTRPASMRGKIVSFNRINRYFSCAKPLKMALSRFEYVKKFELDDKLVPECWIVVRLDGKGFSKFSDLHNFVKPNDKRALDLMNHSAKKVFKEINDIVIAYGQSDEYSFVLKKSTTLYSRRSAKITTNIASLFAAAYTFYWPLFFEGEERPKMVPSFDARAVQYPNDQVLRDYLSWRQADCHINNLYNTTFWALIQKGGLSNQEAGKRLTGTFAKDKNEILFSEFAMNYNDEPDQFKKGTILVKDPNPEDKKNPYLELYQDLIGDTFWEEHPELLMK